jgi:hypothetical protein
MEGFWLFGNETRHERITDPVSRLTLPQTQTTADVNRFITDLAACEIWPIANASNATMKCGSAWSTTHHTRWSR